MKYNIIIVVDAFVSKLSVIIIKQRRNMDKNKDIKNIIKILGEHGRYFGKMR